MSSSISIGFVFEKAHNISETLCKFLTYIMTDGKIQKLSYSTDSNGDNWEDVTVVNHSIDEISSKMVDYHFGKVTIEAPILKNKKTNFSVSIHKLPQGGFGFLIEIDIEQLFKTGDVKALKSCSDKIIQFCKNCFDKTNYQYSFCDHEVNLEYCYDTFKSMDKDIYSIAVIPKTGEFEIKLAPWEIDGLTNRCCGDFNYPEEADEFLDKKLRLETNRKKLGFKRN